MKSLVTALVQTENNVGSASRNAQALCTWIEHAAQAGAGLVVFPECCLTGYATAHAADIAIDAGGPEAEALEAVAAQHGIAVGYGFVERNGRGARPFATYVIAGPDGCLSYRKTHLGTREREAFTPGDALPVATIAGARVGVQLCWEAHLPDITAALRAQGAELVLMPHAGGPGGTHRLELWQRYLPARALDNGLFVIACNALRHEVDGVAGGGIAAYAPDGTRIAESAAPEESMLVVEVGGLLPRETPDDEMRAISYFDRRRPELYGC